MVAAYVELSRQSTTPGTIDSYENVAKRIPVDLYPKDIRDLTARDLDMFLASLRSDGYAASTVKQTHAVIRAALGQALRWG